MMALFKQGIDRVLDRFISRKLLVWIIATVFMFMSKVESADWVMISMVYIGSQGALDIAERFIAVKNTTFTKSESVSKNV